MSDVVLVHDYLTQRGGAERVVLVLTKAFPEAPLYTSLYDPDGTFPEFSRVDVRTLPLNRISAFRRRHRLAFPLYAPSFAAARLQARVALCSSSGWAHGIRVTGRKVVYCHSPPKWLYRTDDYLGGAPGAPARLAAAILNPWLRAFDRRAAASADVYVANSMFIADQIHEVYGIEAAVVPPPLAVDPEAAGEPVSGLASGFVLIVARLLPYKHVREVVQAFTGLPDFRLVVVGDGPLRGELEATAPANVSLLGEVDDARLRWLYRNSIGLLAASREDFGLTPIEAASFGKPVAALRWGGFLDTVREGETGLFFDAPLPEQISAAARELGERTWDSDLIRRHAASFGEEQFIAVVRDIVDGQLV